MSTVEKQPPPSFLAPYPATKPRRSLLMIGPTLVKMRVTFAP